MIYDSIIDRPWFVILMLLLIFGSIVIIVMFIKKYAKPFQNQDKPKSDKEIAEEEVNRMVVDLPPDEDKKLDEASKELAQKAAKDTNRPSESEAAEEEVNRSTRPVEDEEAAKAMAKYAAEHPEEAEEVQPDKKPTK